MHGLGTDEANLIRVLATKTNDQVIALSKRFSYRYGHKGDLLKWIAGARSPPCPPRLSVVAALNWSAAAALPACRYRRHVRRCQARAAGDGQG